ncbi:MAG TPA: Nif3-like dinuclear metal center hexameric protein [Spongiibacteraceae bacterium]|nr:Nif3-like dinuclear metal center hexameric protein [Spongiibacteraceae bacterium]
MSTTLAELLAVANRLLAPERFQDYCPNGLQVEGRQQVRRIVSGVTASQALLEAACDNHADAILVHHGYFWKGESPVVTGMKRNRLQLLLQRDISLIAYHLPLDAHPEVGNNAQFARQLDIEITGGLQAIANPIGNIGRLQEAMSPEAFIEKVAQRLGRLPQLVEGGTHSIRTLAWCTGAAQSYIEQAAALGVDAFLSGEISEPTVHCARELGIHFIAAGHHATERYGVRALGEYLAAQLPIEHIFIDIDNPA